VLTRYTQPEPELQLLISQLKLRLPSQPPPRITAATATKTTRRSEDLLYPGQIPVRGGYTRESSCDSSYGWLRRPLNRLRIFR
jgi:hypothetical protein